MTLPRALLVVSVLVFSTIIMASLFKGKRAQRVEDFTQSVSIEVVPVPVPVNEPEPIVAPAQEVRETVGVTGLSMEGIPQVDRIQELFNVRGTKFPIVETVIYKKRVDWLPGRAAWLSDYASHYKTSRHFIARSLNGHPDYYKQDPAEGDRFNVLRADKNIHFHLLIDLSRSKMWFYYLDRDNGEQVLVKTYDVSLGRPDASSHSGFLTPIGRYSLGEKVGIYKPNKMGLYNGQKTEMIRVFGTRWLPFDEELGDCSEAAKGLGIHGLPWTPNEKGELEEDCTVLGKHESDGCVRLSTQDIEELFAILITKSTSVELVKNYHDAKGPPKVAT